MLWVNSLFDWDLDDEDLMDVCVASIVRGNASEKTPHVNTRNDAHMNPKDLPDHVQHLMEWIAENISIWELEELAAAIFE